MVGSHCSPLASHAKWMQSTLDLGTGSLRSGSSLRLGGGLCLLAGLLVPAVLLTRPKKTCARVDVAEALRWRSLPQEPLILTGFEANRGEFANATRRDAILAKYGATRVALTSSNSYSEHASISTLGEYLSTRPRAMSNESKYLFGPQEWLEETYAPPACGGPWCAPDAVTASFGVGLRGSGVSFHAHGSGFSEVLHGRKRWLFYATMPAFDPDVSTQTFVEDVMRHVHRKPDADCEHKPTELLYFPKEWWHATLNLDDYNVFVSTFISDDAGETAPLLSVAS